MIDENGNNKTPGFDPKTHLRPISNKTFIRKEAKELLDNLTDDMSYEDKLSTVEEHLKLVMTMAVLDSSIQDELLDL